MLFFTPKSESFSILLSHLIAILGLYRILGSKSFFLQNLKILFNCVLSSTLDDETFAGGLVIGISLDPYHTCPWEVLGSSLAPQCSKHDLGLDVPVDSYSFRYTHVYPTDLEFLFL